MAMGLDFGKWVGLGLNFLDPYLGRPDPWVQTRGSNNMTRDGSVVEVDCFWLGNRISAKKNPS